MSDQARPGHRTSSTNHATDSFDNVQVQPHDEFIDVKTFIGNGRQAQSILREARIVDCALGKDVNPPHLNVHRSLPNGTTATPTHSQAVSLNNVNTTVAQAPSLKQPDVTPSEPSVSNHVDIVGQVDQLYMFKQIDMLSSIWPSISGKAAQDFPEFAATYNQIFSFQLPNFLGAQVQVKSALNVDQWDDALQSYHDRDICKFLWFGWPLGYLANTHPVSIVDKHTSASIHEKHIQKFIDTELDFNALLGPFQVEPFTPWTRCSPMMTRPKKDSELCRVIVDLSFPIGADVNSAIDITSYMGQNISFKLPTITDLVAKIQLDGGDAFIWKADLCRAYRQLRIDPLDTSLTGIKFQGQFYLDLCPPFGCRSSSAACQRVSNALAYIMGQAGYFLLAYLDDYAGCEPSLDRAIQSYDHFIKITKSLGLQLALNKCVKPSKKIEWLGYVLDVEAMTLSIPQPKLDQVLTECRVWSNRKRASRNMIQKLIGKLVHISNGVAQARKFISRIHML